jgi:Aerotolerance regulator N-terminal
MSFLNPSLLWGLLAILIPIIIHLFNFRRVKKVNFSNITLLKTVNTQAKTFLKLKQWLILASRILFISCLVLAFAQPFIPSKNEMNNIGRSITSIYIDNSASMQNETDNKAALSMALKKVERLANELPKSAKNQLVTNDFTNNDFKTLNPSQLKNESSKIETSGSARTIDAVFERQKNIVEKNSGRATNNYFLFSDFQKSTVGDFSKILNDKKNNIYLVPSPTTESHNVFVDSVWLDNPFIRKMQANGLNVKLINSGEKAVNNLPIKLFLGDLQMNSIPTKIEANSSATIHFEFTINENGAKKGKISFEDSPINFDNEFYFVLNASPTVNIIHLYDTIGQNNHIKNAFSNDSLFRFSAFPIQNIDLGLLKNADLLVLEGIEYFNNSANEAIKKFLSNGGSVYFIPARNADVLSYNSLLATFGISNIERNSSPNLAIKPLAEPLKGSRFYKDIFEPTKINDKLLMPSTSELLKWRTIGEPILRTKGSQNYLTSTKANNATIFMQASPLGDEYGNFPQNALFVPILYKMAAMSIKPSVLAFRFDESIISIEDKNYNEKTLVKLRKDGNEMIPVQQLLGSTINLELPKVNELNNGSLAGYYDLVIGNSTIKTIAINYSNKESFLEQYNTNELKNLFAKNKNIKILDQESANDFAQEYASLSQGKYFWKYLVMTALLFLAIEILIIRFWK